VSALFFRIIEILFFLFCFSWLVKWFIREWRKAGTKATEDVRETIEQQSKIVEKSNAKHKGLDKKKKAVQKFKA
jgi:hypothetical protein